MSKIMQCKECKKPVDSKADVCPHCGAKDEIVNTPIKIKDWKVVFLTLIFTIVAVKFVVNNTPLQLSEHKQMTEAQKDKEWNAQVDREREQYNKAKVHQAWAYIQIYVERQLKSPRSAEFRFGGYRDVEYLGNGLYSFNSYVDATNSFNAKIRTYFVGTIQEVPGGWEIKSFAFLN